jgi:multisubunit Na+/H+ antiporter MnhG subunit
LAWLRFSVALALALFCLGAAFWLWRRATRGGAASTYRALGVVALGAAGAALATLLERWVLGLAGAASGGSAGAERSLLVASVVFSAPLEEALKTAAIWPLYVGRRLTSGRLGAAHGLLAGAGFAAAETLLLFVVWGQTSWLDLVRSALALPAHFCFAALWAYMLGGSRRDRYFAGIWLGATTLHGIYDHIVFARPEALLVVVVPMALMMGLGLAPLLAAGATDSQRRGPASLLEPPSVGTVREILSRQGRPLMLHWILAGALVTLGVTLVFLALAVYVGHRLGLDFSLVDEPGFSGAVPVALLGAALLLAFPVSAYLIARASGAVSVLEPAWATGAAIVAVLALFSVTEPTALVIALAVLPVGFALACAGAWFGLERR